LIVAGGAWSDGREQGGDPHSAAPLVLATIRAKIALIAADPAMGREREPLRLPRPGLEAVPVAGLVSWDLALGGRGAAGRLIGRGTLASVLVYSTYQALLTALRGEALVRRGVISRREQGKLVLASVVDAVRQGAAVGLVLSLLLLAFPWLSLPLTLAGSVGAGKASLDLFHAFWDGLNETQRLELHGAAYRAGISLGSLFQTPDPELPEA